MRHIAERPLYAKIDMLTLRLIRNHQDIPNAAFLANSERALESKICSIMTSKSPTSRKWLVYRLKELNLTFISNSIIIFLNSHMSLAAIANSLFTWALCSCSSSVLSHSCCMYVYTVPA